MYFFHLFYVRCVVTMSWYWCKFPPNTYYNTHPSVFWKINTALHKMREKQFYKSPNNRSKFIEFNHVCFFYLYAPGIQCVKFIRSNRLALAPVHEGRGVIPLIFVVFGTVWYAKVHSDMCLIESFTTSSFNDQLLHLMFWVKKGCPSIIFSS